MTLVSIFHLRQLVRSLNYAVSHHATDELDDDQLSILDLETIILSGSSAEVVAKLSHSGKLFVITVYAL